MSNADIFLDYYNKIDSLLQKEGGFDEHAAFSHKVKLSKNKIVRKFKDELLSLGDLRNAIVHNPRIGEKPIAEPHESTVQKIKEIYSIISNPKKVIPEFEFQVKGAKEDDYINDILKEMRKNSFSQFPVYDANGHVIELINTNTIARWLASILEKNGTILIDEVKVEDFLAEIEYRDNYKFISGDATVFDAYDLFISQIDKNKRNLDVLFITHSGNRNEKLLGMITIEDIAKVMSKKDWTEGNTQ